MFISKPFLSTALVLALISHVLAAPVPIDNVVPATPNNSPTSTSSAVLTPSIIALPTTTPLTPEALLAVISSVESGAGAKPTVAALGVGPTPPSPAALVALMNSIQSAASSSTTVVPASTALPQAAPTPPTPQALVTLMASVLAAAQSTSTPVLAAPNLPATPTPQALAAATSSVLKVAQSTSTPALATPSLPTPPTPSELVALLASIDPAAKSTAASPAATPTTAAAPSSPPKRRTQVPRALEQRAQGWKRRLPGTLRERTLLSRGGRVNFDGHVSNLLPRTRGEKKTSPLSQPPINAEDLEARPIKRLPTGRHRSSAISHTSHRGGSMHDTDMADGTTDRSHVHSHVDDDRMDLDEDSMDVDVRRRRRRSPRRITSDDY